MNQTRFNQTLKFSFGHVFAVLALVLISYISFMGTVYSTGGDFKAGDLVAAVVFSMLCILTYTIQLLKASEQKFARRIVRERIMVFIFILACMAAFLPFSHFWTVFARRAEMEQRFGEAIGLSRQIFNDYEAYTNTRYKNYEKYLIEAASHPDSEDYRYIEFTPGLENEQIAHLLLSMKLKHRSKNYEALKTAANAWIDQAQVDVTTYNIFLLGNIEAIKQAIGGWNEQLRELTEMPLAKESRLKPTAFDSQAETEARKALEEVQKSFAQRATIPNAYAWISGILLFALLSLPYHIQKRHTKAQRHYGFWKSGRKKHKRASLMAASSREEDFGREEEEEEEEENEKKRHDIEDNIEDENGDGIATAHPEEKPNKARGKMGKGFTLSD